ncbi:MAG: 4-hydroxybutyrate CoA-transferase, partial [Mucinivorans sp.]
MKPINIISADEAVKVVKSGDHIHFSSVASAPQCLIKALMARGDRGELHDVHIHHLHTEGPAPYGEAKYEGIFQSDQFFVGSNLRKATQSGYADYIPIFLSETQKLYRCGALPINVAMIQVSPPDKHGYVSLGTSVDATLAAVELADTVIAVINKHVPRSFGDAMIKASLIDLWCQDDTPLEEALFAVPTEVEVQIGKNCAALIEDGACLQMGIGAIPNAVLAQLTGHKNLGI